MKEDARKIVATIMGELESDRSVGRVFRSLRWDQRVALESRIERKIEEALQEMQREAA